MFLFTLFDNEKIDIEIEIRFIIPNIDSGSQSYKKTSSLSSLNAGNVL